MMFQRMFVLLDGSPVAERAIPVAARLARLARGQVVLFSSITPVSPAYTGKPGNLSRSEESARLRVDAANYLADVQERYAPDLRDVEAGCEIVCGSAPETLAGAVYREHIDALVGCLPRGERGSQWRLECIAQPGIHPQQTSLLIVSAQEQAISALDGTRPLRLLLPLDGSLFSETAIEPALQLLSQWESPGCNELCLIRVIDLLEGEGMGEEEAHMSRYTAMQARQEAERYLHTVVEHLRKRFALSEEVSITCLAPTGVGVTRAIFKQTGCSGETEQSHLIVMATHGHEDTSLLNPSSVAEHLLNETRYPLLLVPPIEAVIRPVLLE